ncbi:DUF6585 family protein [Spirillospora sp. CA-294931]|uniref:DUF6585 family protein n=1 Tax=Spirillospora sp. CA-294931 TaxID=3240042 RepID=UPI003D901E54
MSFPEPVLERAAARRLGEPVRAFTARAGGRRYLAWAALLGLAGAVLALAATSYLRDDRPEPGVPVAVLSAGYLGGAVWLAGRTAPRGRRRAVYLFKDGIVLTGPGDPGVHQWDTLASVTVSGVQRAARGTTRWTITVTTSEGERIRLGDFADAHELGEALSAEVAGRAFPRHLAEIEAGETVRLGPFAVDLDGVEKDGVRAPWAAVSEVGIDNGMVYLRTADDLQVLTSIASRTPNAVAFVELCSRLRERHTENEHGL